MVLAAGAIVLIPGVPLLLIALNANLLAVALMPPALVFLLMMTNDSDLMGTRVNSMATNTMAIFTTILVTSAGAGYAVVAFANTFGNRVG